MRKNNYLIDKGVLYVRNVPRFYALRRSELCLQAILVALVRFRLFGSDVIANCYGNYIKRLHRDAQAIFVEKRTINSDYTVDEMRARW